MKLCLKNERKRENKMNPETVRADGTKFKFKTFFQLINQAKPKYLLLIIGVVLASISSAITVYVPKLAQTLINERTAIELGWK